MNRDILGEHLQETYAVHQRNQGMFLVTLTQHSITFKVTSRYGTYVGQLLLHSHNFLAMQQGKSCLFPISEMPR